MDWPLRWQPLSRPAPLALARALLSRILAILISATTAYIRSIALPALEEGAKLAQRPRPPLIVSAPIVLTTDFGKVRAIAHAGAAAYAQYPTYEKMFREGGYAFTPDGKLA